jgi:hypothetical protein
VVLGLHEPLGTATTTPPPTPTPHPRATATDLLERPNGPIDLRKVGFGPFEIKTILLRK